MHQSPVLWSARACPFRKAGVYYGLSPANTHVDVAERILPRRGQVYGPATITVRPSQVLPCVYIAVRDPSAVRVVPVPKPLNGEDRENGHVSLIFPPGTRPLLATAAPSGPATEAIRRYAADGEHAGFVVSVGLAVQREEEFHRQVLCAIPGIPYGELCERIEAVRQEFSN